MADAAAQLEEAFRWGLTELLEALPALEESLGSLTSDELHRYGREAAQVALAPLVWRAVAGEVLTTEEVRAVLPVSRQALHKRVEAGTLLGLPAGRTTLYPRWQSSASGDVRPSVAAVIRIFRERLGEEFDPRIVASWATTPQPELKESTPAEWLAMDGDATHLASAASRAAEDLTR